MSGLLRRLLQQSASPGPQQQHQRNAEEEEEASWLVEPVPAALLYAPALVMDCSVALSLSRAESNFLEDLRQWAALDARHARALVRSVPARLRGLAWRQICGSAALETGNRDLFERYAGAESCPFDEIIEKDVRRMRIPAADRALWETALRRVLRAFAVMTPDVGYTQGMSSCGLLVLRVTGRAENEAFWLLSQAVAQHALGGLWSDNLPLLKLLMYAVDRLLELRMPRLFGHFKALNVTPLLYASQWFTGCFAYQMPFGLCARVWDVFLAEGITWLLKVALAILHVCQTRLLALGQLEPLVDALREAPATIDPALLLRTADDLSFVTAELVCQLKAEFNHPAMSAARNYF